jgi:hypothetical protein
MMFLLRNEEIQTMGKISKIMHDLRRVVLFFFLLFALCIGCDSVDTHNIYVSPKGDDANPGTKALPLASLEGAKNHVRNIKASNKGDIIVWFQGGDYYLEKTVVFGLEDSGEGESTITYQAVPDEKPVFSATIGINNWEKADTPITGLPEAAHGKIWVKDLSQTKVSALCFLTLYDTEGRLPRARSKGFIPTGYSSELEGSGEDKSILHFPSGILKSWPNIEDIEIFVRPHHAWILNILPLESVDEKTQIAKTTISATYSMGELYFLRGLESCWVENVLESLDEPGEWVLNTKEGKLYLWPRNDMPPQGIRVPLLREYIRVEGNIDESGPNDTPVRNLCFRGLTFNHGERDLWTEDDRGLQHDWDMYDKANAMIRLRGAENCVIELCHFTQSGGSAIRVDMYGQSNQIQSNHIEHMGGCGILLSGYGPGTKDVNKLNLIYNNHIHHIGEIYWHAPGIFLWQSSGNRVANNLIHNTPYSGIIISGLMDRFESRAERLKRPGEGRMGPGLLAHDNLIEYNEIHTAMELMGDGNGIYLRGAGNGNIIRRNYIHHLLAPVVMQSAIRTDGGQKGTLITENLIYKCVSHGIHLKLNNRAENNIIADILETVHNGRKITPIYFKLREGPLTGGSIQRNILYHPGKNTVFFDQGENPRLHAAWAKEADTDFNLYYCAGNPELSQAALDEARLDGIESNGLASDPLFVDPENGDFRFRPGSPALKMGFVPFDLSKVGLVDTP